MAKYHGTQLTLQDEGTKSQLARLQPCGFLVPPNPTTSQFVSLSSRETDDGTVVTADVYPAAGDDEIVLEDNGYDVVSRITPAPRRAQFADDSISACCRFSRLEKLDLLLLDDYARHHREEPISVPYPLEMRYERLQRKFLVVYRNKRHQKSTLYRWITKSRPLTYLLLAFIYKEKNIIDNEKFTMEALEKHRRKPRPEWQVKKSKTPSRKSLEDRRGAAVGKGRNIADQEAEEQENRRQQEPGARKDILQQPSPPKPQENSAPVERSANGNTIITGQNSSPSMSPRSSVKIARTEPRSSSQRRGRLRNPTSPTVPISATTTDAANSRWEEKKPQTSTTVAPSMRSPSQSSPSLLASIPHSETVIARRNRDTMISPSTSSPSLIISRPSTPTQESEDIEMLSISQPIQEVPSPGQHMSPPSPTSTPPPTARRNRRGSTSLLMPNTAPPTRRRGSAGTAVAPHMVSEEPPRPPDKPKEDISIKERPESWSQSASDASTSAEATAPHIIVHSPSTPTIPTHEPTSPKSPKSPTKHATFEDVPVTDGNPNPTAHHNSNAPKRSIKIQPNAPALQPHIVRTITRRATAEPPVQSEAPSVDSIFVIIGWFPSELSEPIETCVIVKDPGHFLPDLRWHITGLRGWRAIFSFKSVQAFGLYKCRPQEHGHVAHHTDELEDLALSQFFLATSHSHWRAYTNKHAEGEEQDDDPSFLKRLDSKAWADWVHKNLNNNRSCPFRSQLSLKLMLRWSQARIAIAALIPLVLSFIIGAWYTAIHNDAQTGFTIASYIVTAGAFIIAILAVLTALKDGQSTPYPKVRVDNDNV